MPEASGTPLMRTARFNAGVRANTISGNWNAKRSVAGWRDAEVSNSIEKIRRKTPPRAKVNLECSVILISACQDNQVAMDGTKNGLFTETLLKVWDNGSFIGGYHHFRNEIAGFLPPTQSPKYAIAGHRERAFEHQRPFSITVPRVAAAA